MSQIALAELLQEKGWPDELAELVADAVGCHHGSRAAPTTLDHLKGDRRALGKDDWTQARRDLLEALLKVFKPGQDSHQTDSFRTGLHAVVGTHEFCRLDRFQRRLVPLRNAQRTVQDLRDGFNKRRASADQALDAIGWEPRTPLSTESKSFEQIFGFAPRPLQQAVTDALANVKEPVILLVEAPMGEGKTEAAFFAHLELQRRFGHRGMYVALPTKATGNAMFKRTLKFLRQPGNGSEARPATVARCDASKRYLPESALSGIHDPATGGEIRAGEWFTHKKRALLSEYGVGTVDQALLPILPVRHNFVRLWGLANRVVVFDEIHAYDAYTGTLLVHLLRWLLALGSSVVLLSATLPPSIRRKLAEVVNARLPEQEKEYPRLSVFHPGRR